jgi:hypothetical protein
MLKEPPTQGISYEIRPSPTAIPDPVSCHSEETPQSLSIPLAFQSYATTDIRPYEEDFIKYLPSYLGKTKRKPNYITHLNFSYLAPRTMERRETISNDRREHPTLDYTGYILGMGLGLGLGIPIVLVIACGCLSIIFKRPGGRTLLEDPFKRIVRQAQEREAETWEREEREAPRRDQVTAGTGPAKVEHQERAKSPPPPSS